MRHRAPCGGASALHLGHHRSHHRGRHRIVCHGRRHHPGRAQRAHRLRRAARHPRYHPPRASRRVPNRRVRARARPDRRHRAPTGPSRHLSAHPCRAPFHRRPGHRVRPQRWRPRCARQLPCGLRQPGKRHGNVQHRHLFRPASRAYERRGTRRVGEAARGHSLLAYPRKPARGLISTGRAGHRLRHVRCRGWHVLGGWRVRGPCRRRRLEGGPGKPRVAERAACPQRAQAHGNLLYPQLRRRLRRAAWRPRLRR